MFCPASASATLAGIILGIKAALLGALGFVAASVKARAAHAKLLATDIFYPHSIAGGFAHDTLTCSFTAIAFIA